MSRASNILIAAFFAAILGVVGLAPARAASIPAGSAIMLDAASKPQTSEVHHRGWHRGGWNYRPARVYRRGYYRPVRVYRRPVYYNRCVTRPRVVWTPYGYVRRYVRVCRY